MITPASPVSPEGGAVLRAYFTDIVSRAYRRAATDAEVEAAMRAEPSDDLVPPTGLFLLASDTDAVLGCAGLRLLPAGIAEVTRLYVVPDARGSGLGRRLLRAVEDAARSSGVVTLRLDTRSELVEARRLYARAGYREVAPFNDTPLADHWFEKDL